MSNVDLCGVWFRKEGKVIRDEFQYLGIQMKSTENGTYKWSQLNYIEELRKVEVLVGVVKRDVGECGLEVLRRGTGKLNWVAQGQDPNYGLEWLN